MKKVMLVGALGLLSLASCKKDWTCTCTYNGETAAVADYADTKKADAKASCASYESIAKLGDPSASCSID